MIRLRVIALAVTAGLLAAAAQAHDLTPTGTLRATFLAQNPVQAVTDAATGEVRGPAAELTRALAGRLGAAYSIKGLPGVAAVMASVKSGESDIGFLAYDAVRAVEVDFSQTYSLAQNTYLVLDASPLRVVADLDRAGISIGVGERDAGDFFLTAI